MYRGRHFPSFLALRQAKATSRRDTRSTAARTNEFPNQFASFHLLTSWVSHTAGKDYDDGSDDDAVIDGGTKTAAAAVAA